tara:strand:+ start:212 stop:406 length:195 start_codon:yes stop_codon:yes gene_type:complete
VVLEEQEVPPPALKVQMADLVVVAVLLVLEVMLLVAVLLIKAMPVDLELMGAITEEVVVVVPAL